MTTIAAATDVGQIQCFRGSLLGRQEPGMRPNLPEHRLGCAVCACIMSWRMLDCGGLRNGFPPMMFSDADKTRRGTLRAIAAAFAIGLPSLALAQYDPPTGYYNAATATDPSLKSQLRAIIGKDWFTAGSTTQHFVSYAQAPDAFIVTDRDPNNASNIILVYTGASVSNVWDTQNLPWNREHTWPDSLGLGGGGP